MAGNNKDTVKDEILAAITARMQVKEFQSGKTGFGAYGKVETTNGRRFQLSVNVTELK